MTKIKVLWIDDNPSRKDTINLLNNKNDLDINLILPNKFDENLLQKMKIVVVDYFLDQTKIENKYFDQRGLSFASKIREKNTTIPIILISSDPKFQTEKDKFDFLLKNFELIIDDEFIREDKGKKFTEFIREIVNLGSINSNEDIFKKLKIPKIAETRMIPLLNSEKKYLIHKNINLYFVRWIINELMYYPGMMYNLNWVSSILGIKEDYFLKKYSEIFKEAEYKGVFSGINREKLWWSDKIKEIVISNFSGNKYSSISKAFIIENSIPKNEILCCPSCDEIYTNYIARNSQTKDEFRPVHYKCTEHDKEAEIKLFFDQPRIFNEKNETHK